ncbi:MAG: hypothetical protein IJV54_08620 [Bacteroidales bacterium]|nr:hypothetical protein [Bacteroidales bacterium]MBR1434793.1 hypothetical protein [Bacteroidales bacterium]
MERAKTQIVLDADIIIHFSKAGKIQLLPEIFPEYDFVLLDIVKKELPTIFLPSLQTMIDRDKSVIEIIFGESDGEKKEYARLISSSGPSLGKGESACMVYCRYHHNVVGSSNLKDISSYCKEFGITYLTTIDFLFYAIRRGKMTEEEANDFITEVNTKGSNLPHVDLSTYVCDKL